jgi:hypothetical protein
MILDPLADTIIVITFFITGLKTIYHSCIEKCKEKEEDIILKSNQSLSYDDDEEYDTSLLSPIQKSHECFQCHIELQGFNKQNYFAFDKEYCEICWNIINYNIINNRS